MTRLEFLERKNFLCKQMIKILCQEINEQKRELALAKYTPTGGRLIDEPKPKQIFPSSV